MVGKNKSLRLVACLIAAAADCGTAGAQVNSTRPTPEQENVPAAQTGEATALPTFSALMAQRQEVTQDPSLDETIRAALVLNLEKAIENVQAIEQTDIRIAALAQELKDAPQNVSRLQGILGMIHPNEDPSPEAVAAMDVDALSSRLKEAEDSAAAAQQLLGKIEVEIDWRSARRSQLEELINQTGRQLQEATQSLAAPPAENENPRVAATRLVRQQSRQQRLRREMSLMEQESRTFEGANRYWALQRDVADRESLEAGRIVQFWQRVTADARRAQAENESRRAQQTLTQSPESIRVEAERNLILADENTRLVETRQRTQAELDRLDAELAAREIAFTSLKKRAEAADFSPAIGLLLRNQRSTLPDRNDVQVRIKTRHAEISRINLELMEWEAERKPLIDLGSASSRIIEKLDLPPNEMSLAAVNDQVQSILSARLNILGDLIENGGAQLDRLVRLDSQEKRLMVTVDAEALWLAEHVLWVRSTLFLGSQPGSFATAAITLLNRTNWDQSTKLFVADLTQNYWWWVALAVILIGLAVVSGPAKRRIGRLGEMASRSNCTEFSLTSHSLFLTTLIALPIPFLAWSVGGRLATISEGDDLLLALGSAFQLVGVLGGVFELIRQLARPRGIGESHFGWSRNSLKLVRRSMRLLIVAFLPLLLIVAYSENLGDDELSSSFGRVAYLAAMALGGWVQFQLLRPASPIIQSLQNTHSDSVLWRMRWVWVGLILASPIVLCALSLVGYQYTAFQLTGRVAATVGSGFAALFITALLSRWLLVSYRKLAIQRGRERRRLLALAAQADPDQPIPQDTSPDLRLVEINVQARRLLRMAAGAATLLALYFIWIDLLPALGVFGNIELWPNSLVAQSDDSPVVWVTAVDVFVALFIAGLTLVASRNVPGLMEMVILQRLPLDSGARYAATTVSRYLIVLAGFLFGFRAIGIGWSSVQWLVAAMTVGLGFGLQEIFANFVSGIILLFERPVRVGDTVTIGNITGTVTRIQIRATTILDWDNRELIVPNREFVTGNLMNWTLSSATLRLVVTVGVAYGSDTRLVTRLLYRVSKENEQVLGDPEPVVVFTEFGESSLTFELRLYVNGLMNYRRLKHELHLAIDDLFREHKIEIAFPQRDLHLKSIAPGFRDHQAFASSAQHPARGESAGA